MSVEAMEFLYTEDKISEVVGVEGYEKLVRNVCQQALKSVDTTYVFLERYAYINGYAGSGVALLSGNIGYARNLFLDVSEGLPCDDMGMHIASRVFSATVDEHTDRRLGHSPHRVLAKIMLDAVAGYAGYDQNIEQRNRLDKKSSAFLSVVDSFKRNYQGSSHDIGALIQALGYHIASEFLADKEYQIIDEEVWFRHPDEQFRHHVKRGKNREGGWYGPWSWITTHGHYGEAENDDGHGVEHEHWVDALEAARLALKYKPEIISEKEFFVCLERGLLRFRRDWKRLFNIVLEEMDAVAKGA
ncbi:MAG: hypothetical protein OXT65_01080 [Alphaproteobacteria bacterium]|nr:hypothetical protein [Alphaproteobacteria bacterium]